MSGSNIKLLENYAGYCADRAKLINENIANAATKNYKTKDISFQDMMDSEMNSNLKTTNKNHFKMSNLEVDYKNKISRSDEILEDAIGNNNVQIDNEMVKMAENSIKFKFASRKISNHYKDMQRVIKGGGA